MERAFEIQRAARENVQDLRSYLTDLGSWESEMKRKEAALRGDTEQELPPVRSRLKKERPVGGTSKPKAPRIRGSDYNAWDRFDVEGACEEVDMSSAGPTSLDGRGSTADKTSKLREEAQYEKERGNVFVKQKKWAQAIECYNRAIELVDNDAIYFANRALCHLMLERLHQAESDCTAAIKLDSSYVKAYQRRSAAREKLGSLRAASQDLTTVLQLEPNNMAAASQLRLLKQRMATKGGKFKSSPVTTPTEVAAAEGGPLAPHAPPPPRPLHAPAARPPGEPPHLQQVPTEKVLGAAGKARAVEGATAGVTAGVEAWRDGSLDGAEVVQPVQKPPHLRSKTPLKPIPIQEIEFGETEPKNPRVIENVIEIVPNDGRGDFRNTEAKTNVINHNSIDNRSAAGDAVYTTNRSSPTENSRKLVSPMESSKLESELVKEKNNNNKNIDKNATEEGRRQAAVVAPSTCVQFMLEWKARRGDDARLQYLSAIDPEKLPAIFQDSLESDVLAGVLRALAAGVGAGVGEGRLPVAQYLCALASVRRFSALAMFLSPHDKQVVRGLLQHCSDVERTSREELAHLAAKFEL